MGMLDQEKVTCPSCRSSNTHHGIVEVFDRHEDAAIINEVVTDGQLAAFSWRKEKDSRCPSARRHGLRVRFWCEDCTTPFSLLIAQHKGETQLITVPEEVELPDDPVRPSQIAWAEDLAWNLQLPGG